MSEGHADARASAIRQARRAAILTSIAALAPPTLIGVALTATSWWEGLLIAAGYASSFGLLRNWSLDRYPRAAVAALIFTGALWGVGSATATSPISFMPFALIGAMLLARLESARSAWAAGFAAVVAGVGALSLLTHLATPSLVGLYVAIPFAGTLFAAGVIAASERVWVLVRRVALANEVEADLAIAHERARIAADLHDIQGHSLHVVKLRAAVAQRLLERDPERAAAELASIRALADEALAATRDLATARRPLDLGTEAENARRLAEAAGMRVEVALDLAPGDAPHPLLAQVLREGTTNLLRHAGPRRVRIAVARDRVEVENDGAPDAARPERGLARLRERIEAAGGRLETTSGDGAFRLLAEIDADGGAAR